ncbi:molybdenum cofactor guanylyltransferase [Sphingomonas sp.]|uniref:molybdenum cofactor guanylyltransferase n=1 Tax=Sphingomonas sp. TaxID=28214 RepID=UPI003D6CA4D5
MESRGGVLGAVIAGGASRRFGSDKALASIDGKSMLAHVIEALRPQVDDVVVCGREWPDVTVLPDLCRRRIGPLAGLEAALEHATKRRYRAVLSVPVDTLPLPGDLLLRLDGSGPAVLHEQYLIGYWPITCLDPLRRHLQAGSRTVRGWIAEANVRRVAEPFSICNINFPDDLKLIKGHAQQRSEPEQS